MFARLQASPATNPLASPMIRLAIFAQIIGALLTLFAAAQSWRVSIQSQDAWEMVDHTHQVIDALERLLFSVEAAQSNSRGFVISQDPKYISTLGSHQADAWAAFARVRDLTRDNGSQQADIPKLDEKVHQKLAWIDSVVQVTQNGDVAKSHQMIASGRGRGLMIDLQRLVDGMRGRELDLLNARREVVSRQEQNLRMNTILTSGFSVILFFASASLGTFFLRERMKALYVSAQRNRRLREDKAELSTRASTDGLTGPANHQTLMRHLNSEFALASRNQQSFSLLLIDVDRFKAYNDDFGHLAGNEVLKQLAQLLQKDRRSSDLVARFGGEEFAILLRGVRSSDAAIVAERVRSDLAAAEWPNRPVTVSIGTASYDVGKGSVEAIIETADRALYAAKEAGRNTVRTEADLAGSEA